MLTYDTYEDIAALGVPDPVLLECIKLFPQSDSTIEPEPEEAIAQARAALKAAEQAGCNACPQLQILETVKLIPMRDGFKSQIRLFKSPNPNTPVGPLIILIFGGGFLSGSEIQYTPYARLFAKLFGATVVTLSYRLAPEYKFPTAPHDVWDTMIWLTTHMNEVGADPAAGFILGGGSAGGNLALVNAQQWQEKKMSPPLTGVYASIPIFLEEHLVPEEFKKIWFSRTQNADAPLLNKKTLDIIAAAYGADSHSQDSSPMNAADPFSCFPPTYIQVDGLDPLRDDGLILDKILKQKTIPTRLDVYSGMPHAHQGHFPHLAQSQKAVLDTIMGMGWLLKKVLVAEDLKVVETLFKEMLKS